MNDIMIIKANNNLTVIIKTVLVKLTLYITGVSKPEISNFTTILCMIIANNTAVAINIYTALL